MPKSIDLKHELLIIVMEKLNSFSRTLLMHLFSINENEQHIEILLRQLVARFRFNRAIESHRSC